MEEVEEKLAEIEDMLLREYYPFILEAVEDVYDRIQEICKKSNQMSLTLTYINEQNTKIEKLQSHSKSAKKLCYQLVGSRMSETEFESLIEAVHDKITEYKELEQQVIQETNMLYDDVMTCVSGCETDIQNSVIPLSKKEAEIMLEKQDIVIDGLQKEIQCYQQRSRELAAKIEGLRKKNNTPPSEPVVTFEERETTKNTLLWLYSLKRIVGHSVGISDIVTTENGVDVTTKDAVLHIVFDDQECTVNASLETRYSTPAMQEFVKIQTEFDSILKSCIGKKWLELTKNTLYLLFSVNRLLDEIQSIQYKYSVSTSQQGTIQIALPNFIILEIALPEHYPRTLKKIDILNISSSELNQSPVMNLRSSLRNKQFFSLTELLDYIDQCIF